MLTIITSIILTVATISMIGFSGTAMYLLYKQLKKKNKLDELRTYREIYENEFDNLNNILDSFIEEKLNEYRIFNQDTFSDYISDKMEEDILRGVMRLCLEDLSPILISQISIIYNKDNIDSILYKHVTLAVAAAVIENNKEWTYIGADNKESQ